VIAGAEPSKSEPGPATVDSSPDAMKLFATKVQPIFANVCAACHSTGGCGSFSLRRVTPGTTVAISTTQFNFAAAVGQIDKKNPERSKLLTKAISAHGGPRQPPIKDVNAAAYKNLEQWVKLTSNDPKQSAATKSPNNSDQPTDPFDPA